MPHFVVENINKLMKNVEGKVVTILGLTYKGNVDDIRESPAIEVFKQLQAEHNYEVRAYDPHVKLDWVLQDLEQAVKDSDLIVVLSDHDEFKEFGDPDFSTMSNIRIFDTKNVVKRVPNYVEYINYGNLYNYTKKKATAV